MTDKFRCETLKQHNYSVWKEHSSSFVPWRPPYKWTMSLCFSIWVGKTHTLWSRVGPRGRDKSSSDDCRTVKDSAYSASIQNEESVWLKAHNAAQIIRAKVQMLRLKCLEIKC